MGSELIRENVAALFVEGCIVWPKSKMRLKINDPVFENSIYQSSIHDKNLIIIPNNVPDSLCSLVELQNTRKNEQNSFEIEVIGVKRIKVKKFFKAASANPDELPLFLASGELICDNNIESKEERRELLNKLKSVLEIHKQLLNKNTSYSFKRLFMEKFGNPPSEGITFNSSNDVSLNYLEGLSFYFLNIIKSNEKQSFYLNTDLVGRVNWVIKQYEKSIAFEDNPSFIYQFYDVEISGVSNDNLKFTLYQFIGIIVFFLAYKYKIINNNY